MVVVSGIQHGDASGCTNCARKAGDAVCFSGFVVVHSRQLCTIAACHHIMQCNLSLLPSPFSSHFQHKNTRYIVRHYSACGRDMQFSMSGTKIT